MPRSDDRSTPETSSTKQARATTHDESAETGAPLKQHGDALLDGSGSRQGLDPDPTRDAAPHE